MIGWLSGTVRDIDPAGLVLLETGGVGYELTVSMQTLCRLEVGKQAELSVHTHVREDQITLYGFVSPAERALFRKLTSVSGIGARMGINLMSGMSATELQDAIARGDDTAISRTPGIGKKTAQRLILELQGKLMLDEAESGISNELNDLRSALQNLGYKAPQIDAALKQIEPGDFESMFRAALRALG